MNWQSSRSSGHGNSDGKAFIAERGVISRVEGIVSPGKKTGALFFGGG